jgi:flagellar hook-associated protein FlgK
MINAFAIGTSAIDTAQSALNLIGQNIANATTPGYHRQAVDLVNTVAGNATGTGVDVATITRYTNDPVNVALLAGNSDQSATGARLAIRQQIESALNSGTGGIGDQLNNFFSGLAQLSSQPDSTPLRQEALGTANTLTAQLNNAANSIDQLRADTGTQIQQGIARVNTLAGQIAKLNDQISSAEAVGQQPNDLLDQRDQAITSLSKLIDVRTVNQPNGVVNVISSSAPIVAGQIANSFQASTGPTGALVITQSQGPGPVTISSGTLGGQLQEYNTDIPATRSQLDALAGQLAQQVNEVQATGLGLTGPLTSTTGSASATAPTVPLNSAGLPFPVQAGQLTVSVTNAAGNRTNNAVAINPATTTLQSLATALNGITGLQASVTATNQLQIQAQPGYSFDFAGRDTNPPGGGAVANPDTAGVLAALGINGFFNGSTASGITVNPALAANPSLLAASTTGEPGDSTNLQRFSALQSQALVNGQTFADNFTTQAASVGNDVKTLTDQQTAQTGLMQNLTAQEQSVTGVDTNEEFVNLLSYQRMVQGASEYLSTVNNALGAVMNIIH